jgi:DNA polymerase elongation subunit (family B)
MDTMELPRKPLPGPVRVDQPLCFQITDFFVPEADKSKREINRLKREAREYTEYEAAEMYSIYLYGSTEEGHTVCAKVLGYEPYFYLRVPNTLLQTMSVDTVKSNVENFLNNGTYYNVKTKKTRHVITQHYDDHLSKVEVIRKHEFMGFTNNALFAFLKVTVKSLGLFNNLKYFFMNPPPEFTKQFGDEPFRLYESNIDPLLRFIHDRNILPCGWVQLPAHGYKLHPGGNNFSRTDYCVEVKHSNVKPIDKNNTAPLLIASFDIECTSSHGDFPVAIKDYLKLAKDLVNLARYAKYTKSQLTEWIVQAYQTDVIVNNSVKIHRLYAKKPLENLNADKMDALFEELQRIGVECDDEDGSDEEDSKLKSTIAALEFKVCHLLNSFLPPLKGDAIIQIGITVHRYGSDEIIYKGLVSLKSCDPIPGVDVRYYDSEEEVLKNWKGLMQEIDPDILLGYNIFGFDMPYIWDRAKELGIEDFGVGLGRQCDRKCTMLTQNLSSAALGDNVLKYFDMDGVVLVDMYKVMQRSPLDSYKLDFVAHLYLGDNKNDIKPHEIFEKFKGSSADRKEIAEYCIQDCALVNRLFHKLKVLENNNAMGNVCLVPLSYLFMRGQGVKIFSLVAQFCKDKNYAIPVLRGFHEKSLDEESDGYEGAIVLNPKEGMYLEDAITVLDYSSLYPSSMIERNLSHDCYVSDPKYDNLPGVDYCTVSYDLYEGVGDKKVKVGEKHCKFVQLPEGEKGLIPQILMKLLKQRKNTRKKIEYETLVCVDGRSFAGIVREKEDKYLVTDVEKNETSVVPKDVVVERKETYNAFEKLVFDALQVAYKVTANSLYGQIGSRVSPIYLKDIAACTTATGRERIMMAKKFVEEQYGAEVIYGDSVTGYTPVTLRVKGEVVVDKIEDLAKKYGGDKWMACVEAGRQEKEACELPDWIEVWSDKGWTRIHRVIRHVLAEHKRIVRVRGQDGSVCDVTDDHSLLLKDGSEISPREVEVGMELLSARVPVDEMGVVAGCEDDWVAAQVAYLKVGGDRGLGCVLVEKREVSYEGFVYDLTTDNHHFQAGIGQMIVHNTDSIFIKFPFYDPEGNRIRGRDTLALGIAAGQKASQEIKSILPPPQSLEYEKTFFPFIIFSKKRYVGLLYEDDANKKPKQKSMGIVLKRRDNAPLVKKIYGGIIDILLTKYDLGMSVEFLRAELQRLVSSQYPLEDLIITKTLKGSYKDRTKIAHCVLADRMGERDPGNKPQINDRIPYVYIQTGGNAKLQGDKIEHPDYVREKQLLPDYQFYITNQLMKPICQLYALCVERLPEYSYEPGYWTQWDEELKGKPMYEDDVKRKNRIDALREQEVESLLFNAFLDNKRKARTLLGAGSSTGVSGAAKKKKRDLMEASVEEGAPKLVFVIGENKESKVFRWECAFWMHGVLVWKKEGNIPKKNLTKSTACNKVMYGIFNTVHEHAEVLNNEGIVLEFDKYYRGLVRSAIEKNGDELYSAIEKAKQNTDLEAFKECNDILSTIKIADYIRQYKHKFL